MQFLLSIFIPGHLGLVGCSAIIGKHAVSHWMGVLFQLRPLITVKYVSVAGFFIISLYSCSSLLESLHVRYIVDVLVGLLHTMSIVQVLSGLITRFSLSNIMFILAIIASFFASIGSFSANFGHHNNDTHRVIPAANDPNRSEDMPI